MAVIAATLAHPTPATHISQGIMVYSADTWHDTCLTFLWRGPSHKGAGRVQYALVQARRVVCVHLVLKNQDMSVRVRRQDLGRSVVQGASVSHHV